MSGMFVGALVEELVRIPGDTRKFSLTQYRERLSSRSDPARWEIPAGMGMAMAPIKDKPIEYHLLKFIGYRLRRWGGCIGPRGVRT